MTKRAIGALALATALIASACGADRAGITIETSAGTTSAPTGCDSGHVDAHPHSDGEAHIDLHGYTQDDDPDDLYDHADDPGTADVRFGEANDGRIWIILKPCVTDAIAAALRSADFDAAFRAVNPDPNVRVKGSALIGFPYPATPPGMIALDMTLAQALTLRNHLDGTMSHEHCHKHDLFHIEQLPDAIGDLHCHSHVHDDHRPYDHDHDHL